MKTPTATVADNKIIPVNSEADANKSLENELFSEWVKAQKKNRLFSLLRACKHYKILKNANVFDERFYCAIYPDVKEYGANNPLKSILKFTTSPLFHFVRHGVYDGRCPTKYFDVKYYVANNQDIKNSRVNPFVHYIQYGKNEGRFPCGEKRVLIATGVKLEPVADTFEDKMKGVGGNTGNMVFANALMNQLDVKKRDFHHISKFQDEVNDVACVIPSANFIIRGGPGLERVCYDFVKNNNFSTTLAGLGAQSDPRCDTPKKLVEAILPEKIKFFQAAAEQTVSLGIRGEFTAECLELMGIKNYRIIGCPSFYQHPNGVFPKLKKPTADKTVMTVTTTNEHETKLVEFGYKNNSDWVIQMPTELPYIETGEIEYTPFQKGHHFPGLVFDDALFEYMRNHRKMFFNINEWNDYLTNGGFTFAFGSRFHGNMNALNHGIPTLWITHDSRTTELAKTLHLPRITYKEFESAKSMEQLIEYCNYEETEKHYPALFENYKQFLRENGLKSNL